MKLIARRHRDCLQRNKLAVRRTRSSQPEDEQHAERLPGDGHGREGEEAERDLGREREECRTAECAGEEAEGGAGAVIRGEDQVKSGAFKACLMASTLIAAREEGRAAWSCELEEGYFKSGQERIDG